MRENSTRQKKKSKSVPPTNPFDKLLIDQKQENSEKDDQYKQSIIDNYLNGVSYFDEVFYNKQQQQQQAESPSPIND